MNSTFPYSEFAFEIGSGLLTEVRRLQSLLGERDKAIQDMKEEKDDLEKTVEAIRTNLRQQEQSSGMFFLFGLCFFTA
jgi:predicted  nucleic acid-binding Zn-ribbon protein